MRLIFSFNFQVFTLKKRQEEPSRWKRLLLTDKKQKQMHFWMEMAESYKVELDKVDEESEAKDKKAKLDQAAAEAAEAANSKKRIEEETSVKAQVEELVSVQKGERDNKIQKPSMGSFFGL